MRKISGVMAVALMGMSVSCANDVPLPPDYREQVEAYRATRGAEIIAPTGWAALVGLHWLTPGIHTVGHAPGNAVLLTGPSAPASLGTVTVTAEAATKLLTTRNALQAGSVVLSPSALQHWPSVSSACAVGFVAVQLVT